MIIVESSLRDLVVAALDGDAGRVHTLLFDDRDWRIRHFAIRIGSWPLGRIAVVPPVRVVIPSHHLERLAVRLRREELERCPDIKAIQPVSLQEETRLRNQRAVLGFAYDGFNNALMVPTANAERELTEVSETKLAESDPHIRSTKGVQHYRVRFRTGELLGYVEDFVICTEPWEITHIVVRVHGWPHPRRLSLPTYEMEEISWIDQAIITRISPGGSTNEVQSVAGRPGRHAGPS
jgi:hypothetical protein